MASERTEAALEELREALIEDDGMDEGTVDALLHAVQPNQTNLVGNLADLHRLGALVTDEEVDNADALAEAVEIPPSQAPGEEGGTIRDDAANGDADIGSMTKDELLAEADRRGVEVSASSTKADIIAALEG